MSNERNALAELAEQIRFHKWIAETGYALDGEASKDLALAWLILEELAKIRWWRSISGFMPGGNISKILIKCRAIAEE